jgi:VanZ family protein
VNFHWLIDLAWFPGFLLDDLPARIKDSDMKNDTMSGMAKENFRGSIWFRWGPAIIVMALIFLFSSIPSAGLPSFGEFDLPAKKGGHMLGYALLGLAFWHGLGRETPGAWWKAWLLSMLYAVTDEFHQSFVPGRGPWVMDILIDGAGALLALLFARMLRDRGRYHPAPE